MASEYTGPTPIETTYNGFRFRSRLEARMAVFLDALGIPYEYEAQGYDLGGGVRYLPDFWIPDPGYFIEVKGQPVKFGDEAYTKAALLSVSADRYVYIHSGPFPSEGYELSMLTFSPYLDHLDPQFPADYAWWDRCPVCKKWQPTDDDWMTPCRCINFSPNSWEVTAAVLKARQARFEFGETPRGPRD